jgi:hypothetical protein
VFENRVLRIFGPRREKITWERRKSRNELHNLYSSPNIIRVIRWRWKEQACSMHGRDDMHSKF